MMSSDIWLNSWCVTAAPWDRHPGLRADLLSLHPDGSRAPGHAQARREGGQTPSALGQGFGFLAGWFNTTAFGRKLSAGTLLLTAHFLALQECGRLLPTLF